MKNNEILVSIVVPVHNCEKFISNTVSLLINQTYKNIEIILVDDSSNDKSYEVCLEASKKDSRISVLKNEGNLGAGFTRNHGLSHANGKYTMFIDCDDVISLAMVEKVVDCVDRFSPDLVLFGYDVFYDGKDGEYFDAHFLKRSFLCDKDEIATFFVDLFPEGIVGFPWNKAYRTELLRKKNIFFSDMKRLEDGVFNIEFFSQASSVAVLPDVLYHYRQSSQNEFFKKTPENYYDLIKNMVEYFFEKFDCKSSSNYVHLKTFYANEISNCIESVYSPQWNMTRKKRNMYLERLASDSFLKESLKECTAVSKYRKFLLSQLFNERYTSIHITVFAKVFIKKKLNPLFSFLKDGIER